MLSSDALNSAFSTCPNLTSVQLSLHRRKVTQGHGDQGETKGGIN
jgi:hypothetical protein